MKKIYKHCIPFKSLFIIELVFGISILSLFSYLFKNEIYPDIWAVAGPLLGLALVITGLTSSKVKEINVHSSQKIVEIIKESIFKSSVKKVQFQSIKSELKSGNGKKMSIITKLRLIILENGEQIEELNSNLFSLNNAQLKKLHNDLKVIARDM